MLSLQRALVMAATTAFAVAGACDRADPPQTPAPLCEDPPGLAEPVADVSPEPPASAPAPQAPGDAPQLVAQRKELLEAGRVAEAEAVCRTWLAKPADTEKAEAYKCLANVLVHQAKKEGANIMVSTGGQRLGVGGMVGPPRLSGPEIAKAIDELDKAAELSPTDRSIHEGRLFLCLASGQYERGVASLELSMKAVQDAEAYLWLQYMAYFPRSSAKQAAAFAKLIVQANPKHARALVILGGWQTVLGETAKAKANLTQAIAASPRDAMAHWRMGELLEQEADRNGASASFRRSLRLDGPLQEERQSAYEQFVQRKRVGHP